MAKQKTPTDFQDTPPDPEALDEDKPETTTEGDGETGVEPDAPQPETPQPSKAAPDPADPTAAAIARITENGLSDRRFAIRVREIQAAIADNPEVAAAIDRELRMRLLARLEQFAER